MKGFFVWLNMLFKGFLKDFKKYITPSVQLVQNIKNGVDSGFADILTALIPGSTDDTVKLQMRVWLPVVLDKLKLTQTLALGATDEDKIQAAQAFIKLMPSKTDQQKAYQDIATHMALAMISDGKMDWGELSALVVYAYKKIARKA